MVSGSPSLITNEDASSSYTGVPPGDTKSPESDVGVFVKVCVGVGVGSSGK